MANAPVVSPWLLLARSENHKAFLRPSESLIDESMRTTGGENPSPQNERRGCNRGGSPRESITAHKERQTENHNTIAFRQQGDVLLSAGLTTTFLKLVPFADIQAMIWIPILHPEARISIGVLGVPRKNRSPPVANAKKVRTSSKEQGIHVPFLHDTPTTRCGPLALARGSTTGAKAWQAFFEARCLISRLHCPRIHPISAQEEMSRKVGAQTPRIVLLHLRSRIVLCSV